MKDEGGRRKEGSGYLQSQMVVADLYSGKSPNNFKLNSL
jgi:hypothetical protein